jgi:hypothetical protein
MMSAEPHELKVIACTLGSADLAERERRWTTLIRTAGTRRDATPDGIELRFRAEEHVEHELGELIAGERECCAWAQWELGHDPGGALVMHARAAGHGVATLQAMFLRGG